MVFRSKVDRLFKIFITISMLIVGAATFLPIWLDETIGTVDIVILSSIFVLTVGFILWISTSIKYIFLKEHLLVKGGPFRSRIRYEDITRVTKTKDMYTGYRLLTSSDAIEILYKSGAWGSVKISPQDKERFISEIKKRCPGVKVEV